MSQGDTVSENTIDLLLNLVVSNTRMEDDESISSQCSVSSFQFLDHSPTIGYLFLDSINTTCITKTKYK
jgi:hypothetical protein